MASASSLVGRLVVRRLLTPLALGSAGYAAWRVDWPRRLRAFLTGPGRTLRILLLFFALFNIKNLPFSWTYRIFYAIVYHNILRKSPQLVTKALFKLIIGKSRVPLLEIDYNLHKSNSTYFTDLDTARTHLVSYLCRLGLRKLSRNLQDKLVLDPKTGRPARGSMSIALGAVACNFKREIAAYRGYELWTRILSWDRKWMYMVTHFVPKGSARPAEWLDPRCRCWRTSRGAGAGTSWEGELRASAISKYVFKIGRLTVHPAVILAESGLLPSRPGGWTTGPDQLGDEAVDLSDVDLSKDADWDWRHVEAQRRKGMDMAAHSHALENLQGFFDGGKLGALGKFGPI